MTNHRCNVYLGYTSDPLTPRTSGLPQTSLTTGKLEVQGGLGGPLKRGGEAVVENFADDFYMVQVDVDPNRGNGCDVWVRCRDPNNGYRIRTPATDFGATITLSRVKDGQTTSLGSGSFPLGGIGTVKVKIYNDAGSHRFKVWVDGGLQINVTDSAHPAGTIAFGWRAIRPTITAVW